MWACRPLLPSVGFFVHRVNSRQPASAQRNLAERIASSNLRKIGPFARSRRILHRAVRRIKRTALRYNGSIVAPRTVSTLRISSMSFQQSNRKLLEVQREELQRADWTRLRELRPNAVSKMSCRKWFPSGQVGAFEGAELNLTIGECVDAGANVSRLGEAASCLGGIAE